MQHAKDADHLAIYSDATYPVGPDASGRITYVHVPPLNPLTGAYTLLYDFVYSARLTSAFFRSGGHNASLHGDRRILLLLFLSRAAEIPWRQDQRGPPRQTAGLGVCAVAVRPAPADAAGDASAACAPRRAGHENRTAAAGT